MATTATATAQVKVRPLHDRIIVQRIDEGEQKVGGIIIPDTAKEKPQQGKVIAVGKGRIEKDGKVTPLDVKEGDTILFGKYAGQEIKIDGEEIPHHARGRDPRRHREVSERLRGTVRAAPLSERRMHVQSGPRS